MKINQQEINSEILNSHSYVKSGQPFFSPSYYLEPFLNLVEGSEGELKLDATHPTEIRDNNGTVTYKAYERVSAVQEIKLTDELSYKVGYIYALDIGKPIIKVFSGINVFAYTNLCVFGAEKKQEFLISNNFEGAAIQAKSYLQTLRQDADNALEIIHNMKNTFFDQQAVKDMLGEFLINFSKVKNIAGTQCLLSAAKRLTDKKDKLYYFEEQTTAWKVYNALTHDICNKSHLLHQPEKVQSLFSEMSKFKTLKAENTPMLLN